MFDCALNTPQGLVVNKVQVDEESMSLIRIKSQQKIKALSTGRDVVNVEHWTKMLSACAATKTTTWNTLSYLYWVWNTVI